jgi:ParB family chromosome partitioning protein
MGHARALVNVDKIEQQLFIYRKAVAEALSVRKVEELVRTLQQESGKTGKSKTAKDETPVAYKGVQDQLRKRFEAKVQIKVDDKGKGEIVLPFASTDDLNRLLDLLE